MSHLVEARYYNEGSFVLLYTDDEINWIRNGRDIPQSFVDASDHFDVDVERLAELSNPGYNRGEGPGERISATSDYAYFGDFHSLNSEDIKKYKWSEFTDVLLM